MISNKKKGQGSLEYLLIIGGAVLIAVIVIALLTGIGRPSRETVQEQAVAAQKATDQIQPPIIVSLIPDTTELCVQSSDKNSTGYFDISWQALTTGGVYKLYVYDFNDRALPVGTSMADATTDGYEIEPIESSLQDVYVGPTTANSLDSFTKCADTYWAEIRVERAGQMAKSIQKKFNWKAPSTSSLNPTPPTNYVLNFMPLDGDYTLQIGTDIYDYFYGMSNGPFPYSVAPGTNITVKLLSIGEDYLKFICWWANGSCYSTDANFSFPMPSSDLDLSSYVDFRELPNYSLNGETYYVVPFEDVSLNPNSNFGCINVLADANSYTDSIFNQDKYNANCGAANGANIVKFCGDLFKFGYDNWVLPAREHYSQIYAQINAGTFNKGDYSTEWTNFTNDYYLSSTEFSLSRIYSIRMLNGTASTILKTSNSTKYRCIRKQS